MAQGLISTGQPASNHANYCGNADHDAEHRQSASELVHAQRSHATTQLLGRYRDQLGEAIIHFAERNNMAWAAS
jgi:hypothetical protein